VATIGELTDFAIPDLIAILTRRERSGRLTIKAAGEEFQVYFDQGRLVRITSSDLSLRLGRMLVRQNLLNSPQLLDALHAQRTNGDTRPLGAILLERGWITEADLERCIEEQAIEAVARVIDAESGFFVWDAGVEAPLASEPISLEPEMLLRAARERTEALKMLRKQLPAPDTPLFLTQNGRTETESLPAPEEMVISALRGGPRTLEELRSQMALDELSLSIAVLSLCERGVIASRPVSGVARRV